MLRGEIYLVDFGLCFGNLQGGIRPAVIVQNDIGNEHSGTTIVAPMTSKEKKPLPTHATTEATGLRSTILTEQLKTIDKNWLGRKLGTLTEKELVQLDRALSVSIGLM